MKAQTSVKDADNAAMENIPEFDEELPPSHHAPYDSPPNGQYIKALCGCWIRTKDNTTNPTCLECRAELCRYDALKIDQV